MKYRVEIPEPKAARNKFRREVTVLYGGGYDGHYRDKIFVMESNQSSLEFEVKDEYIYKEETTESDRLIFDVYVEYSNESASRKERYSLLPVKIS